MALHVLHSFSPEADTAVQVLRIALEGHTKGARPVGGPFKLTGPGKRRTGPNSGDFYGSFAKIPYETVSLTEPS